MSVTRIEDAPLELELHDAGHVLVKVGGSIEIVVPDETWKALSRRRVTLRFNEAGLFRAGGSVAP